ncbi:MAG: hypothetical protein AB1679_28235 [Actinomycetota bacterium]
MARSVEVAVSADVLVGALSRVSPAAVVFPSMPPKTADPYGDVLGAFVGAEGDFALIVSEEILEQTATALTDQRGLAWAFDAAEEAIEVISGIAFASGGGLATPPARVQLPKVGSVLTAALRAAASPDLGFPRVVVTADAEGIALRAWTPRRVPWPKEEVVTILAPTRFRDLVEQARWHYRQSGQ